MSIEEYFEKHVNRTNQPIYDLIGGRDYEKEFTETELETLTLAELKTVQHHSFFFVKERIRAALSFLDKAGFFNSQDNTNEFEFANYCDSYILDYHGKRVYSESGNGYALLGVWITKIETYHGLYLDRAERKKEVDEANERQRLIKLLANGDANNPL